MKYLKCEIRNEYISPEFELLTFGKDDIITTSSGVESPDIELDFGGYSLDTVTP